MSRINFDPQIPVFDRYAKSFPKHTDIDEKSLAEYGKFSEACQTDHPFDAHFTAYSCPEIPRRLGTVGAYQYKPRMVLFVLDVDGPGHKNTPEWWALERVKVEAFFAKYGRGYAYTTKGGYRIAMGLRDELVIDSPTAALRWRYSYEKWIADIQREFGIVCDPACCDWQRLYRLPRVVRDGTPTTPTDWIGEPDRMLEWREPYVAADDPRVLRTESSTVELPPFKGLTVDQVKIATEELGKAWPDRGRHFASLALCGALAKEGWPEEYIAGFVEDVVTQAKGDPEPSKRAAQARDTLDKLHRGEQVTGWATLADLMLTDVNGEPNESRRAMVDAAVDKAKRAIGIVPAVELFETARKNAKSKTTPPRDITYDQTVAYYQMQREELARVDDLLARVDAKYLHRLKRKASQPLHDEAEGETADAAERAVAVAIVRRAPAGVTDDRLATLLEHRIGDRAVSVIAAARASLSSAPAEVKITPAAPIQTDDDEQKSQATRLLEILAQVDGVEFFKDDHDDPYVTVPTVKDADVRVTYPLDSRSFRMWLDRAYHEGTRGGAISEAARHGVLSILRGRAVFDGELRLVHVRIGHLNGKVYLDLCDDSGRAVEIDAAGWRLVSPAPVRFIRHRGMLPLPEPATGANIDALWKYVKVADNDRLRVLAFEVSVFIATHFFVLALIGPPGSIKTAAGKRLRQIVDPNKADTRMTIGEARDLMISARKSWMQFYDNLKGLTPRESDLLCKLTDGAGHATRELQTNDEETLLDASRPVILTGITEVATAPDLLERTIRIECPRFVGKRLDETEIEAMFAKDWPAILGALLDAVSTGLRNLDTVADLDETSGIPWPRRKAAARLACAAASAFGAKPADMLAAIVGGASDDHEIVLETSPIAKYVIALAEEGFHGPAVELLAKLNGHLGLSGKRPEGWPPDPTRLSGQLREITEALESKHVFAVPPTPKDRPKKWTISKVRPVKSEEVAS
jgi:hypothetical protein